MFVRALVLFALFFCFSPVAVAAEDAPKQPHFTGIADLAWRVAYSHSGLGLTAEVHYPQGIHTQADAIIGKYAGGLLDAAVGSYKEDSERERIAISDATLGRSENIKPERLEYFSKTFYEVLFPSKRYVSILFSKEEYMGGAHGNKYFSVLSFDRESGKELALQDIFPENADACVEKLVPLIADGVQKLKDTSAEPAKRDAASVDVTMRRMALTPQGLRVVYAPYEMGAYAEGAFIVDLPREALIGIGANATLWGK